MPLHARADLWANLPDVVAAYQPVRAPGPLNARYNMRNGGGDAYRAQPGTAIAPAWSPVWGWQFVGTTPNALQLGSLRVATAIVVYGGYTTGGFKQQFKVCASEGQTADAVSLAGFQNAYQYTTSARLGTHLTAGTQAQAGVRCYADGRYVGDREAFTPAANIYGIGNAYFLEAGNTWGSYTGVIKALLLAEPAWSEALVLTATRQMAYCDVNPEWNVWARRRPWFYGPQAGGFQAAWARNANSVLQVGRQ